MKRFFLFAMIAAIGIFVIGCEKAAPKKTTNDPAHPAILQRPGRDKDARSRRHQEAVIERDIRNPDGQHRSRVR